ncbi:MAG: protein kinase [Thermoanaerobaculia bacterium]|nr:protein kinase [Thermoanaerobaculia bacterium]
MSFLTGTRLGPYEITGPLGKGGMGEVYRARDSRLNRSVAIKIMAPHARDSETARRFEREARAVASLSHPNVVALFDIGEQDGVTYVVTELVEGETLRERLARGPLRMEEAAELAAQVAEGLSAAHARGLIHRDVKPENIVIAPEGRAKILDFGLVKEDAVSREGSASEAEPTASVMTEPGMISGTVGYMSPEQVRGEPVDARSDIFALGSVLYEMLTGQRAFAGDSKIERLHAILKEEPALPPADVHIPVELTRVLQRCLAKGKEHRYHSAADLAHDLRAIWLPAGRSAPKIPMPAQPRSFSFARRPVLWLGLAAAVVSALAFLFLRSRTAGSAMPRTIAVLPFQTVGAEPAPRFGLGLADSLIGRLASVKELTVRPTSAVTRFEGAATDAIEAGRQLRVEAVLEGRFQKLEGMTRVSVQLTDVARGAILWSDRLDLPEGRLFEVQDEIATRVVDRLRLELDPDERKRLQSAQQVPDDVMEEYLGARAQLPEAIRMSVEGRRELVARFDRILQRSPDFARAMGARAYARAILNFQAPSPGGHEAALQDAERALALDPNLAEPRVARASLYWSFQGGWKVVEAVRELKSAIARSPGLEVAHLDLSRLYHHTGWLSEARMAVEPARRLNPTGAEVIRNGAHIEWSAGNLRAALAEYRRLPASVVREPVGGRWQILHLRLMLEPPEPVRKEVEAWVAEHPEDVQRTWIAHALLALARARTGRGEIADLEAPIASADPRVSSGHFHHIDHLLAAAHAQNRDAAAAVAYLRKASATGLNCIPCFENDPLIALIHGSAEYAALKTEMQNRDAAYRAALKDRP